MCQRSAPSLSLILACLLLFAPFAEAQNTSPPPAPSPSLTPPPPQDSPDDEVVRITSNLVQIDGVVTDKNGNQVTDLRADELEIFEDGRPQQITNFSYVSNETASKAEPLVAASSAPKPAGKIPPPVAPARLRPEQVRRTVALVVDDLGASFESTHSIRQALRKYVEQQMEPNDLVAIIRTSAGMGALQQFTSDKRQLYAAIERVRWMPSGRGGVSAFSPIQADPFAQARREAGITDDRGATGAREELEEFREQIFAVGTLGALNFIIRGLRELPGRKAIVLFSDGLEMFGSDDRPNVRIVEAVRRLTDLANRASVVIYTIDARGLLVGGLTAADSTADMTQAEIDAEIDRRRDRLLESQSGLSYLAQQTGGFSIRNSNDLGRGVRRVLDDQKGYYLIGYRPDEATFDAAKGRGRFHKITGRVKRPGLKLRLRSGFYGFTEENARPVLRTRAEQLLSALSSPFASGGVRLRLTTLFGNNEREGSFMRSLLHMDARDFTFKEEADGWHKAIVDVIAVTFGDNGRIVNQITRTETMRARGETYKDILKNGLVYNINVPVKKAGAYQLRIAVRDSESERIGSASQFIEVPDIGKKRLTLSGIVVMGEDFRQGQTAADAQTSANAGSGGNDAATGQRQQNNDAAPATPSLRLFRRGDALNYFYYIYNAKLDRATGQPKIQTQVRIFHEGQPIFTGSQIPLDASRSPDMKNLLVDAGLKLGTNLRPGEYLLQVIVTDALAPEKHAIATQWIDFEIIK